MRQLNARQAAEVAALHEREGAKLLPRVLVDFARDPFTALHKRFTWDDTAAAEKCRLLEARAVLRVFVTIIPGSDVPVRAVVSLSTDRVDGGGYRSITAVLANVDLHNQLMATALGELDALRKKYAQLKALAPVWAEVDKVRSRKGATNAAKAAHQAALAAV